MSLSILLSALLAFFSSGFGGGPSTLEHAYSSPLEHAYSSPLEHAYSTPHEHAYSSPL